VAYSCAAAFIPAYCCFYELFWTVPEVYIPVFLSVFILFCAVFIYKVWPLFFDCSIFEYEISLSEYIVSDWILPVCFISVPICFFYRIEQKFPIGYLLLIK